MPEPVQFYMDQHFPVPMETRLRAPESHAVHRCFGRKHPDERFYALAETLLWRNKAVATCLEDAIARGIAALTF